MGTEELSDAIIYYIYETRFPGTDLLRAHFIEVDQNHRKHRRSLRLRREAANCLRIALSEQDRDMAAQLINEALKLKTRSRELAEVTDF